MSRKDVAHGTIDAKDIESGLKILMAEIIIIAITLGMWKSSWWIGGGTFVLLMCLSMNRITATILAVLFSFCWGYAGWWIGHNLIHNTGASIVLCILAGMLSGGIHMAAMEYTTSRREKQT